MPRTWTFFSGFFQPLPQHLHLFFELSLSSRPASSFIVPSFSTWRLPPLEPLVHCYSPLQANLTSGRGENRTRIPLLEPHFECGASTSFATRPYTQLYYYNQLGVLGARIDILYYQPNGQFLWLAILALDESAGMYGLI